MLEIYIKLRDKAGVRDSDVAKNTGIPQSTFSDWKKGKSSPKHEKLQKIADYFGVSLDYLLGNSYMEGLGFYISDDREFYHYSALEFAQELHITVDELNQYENNKKPIREDIFDDMLDALNTNRAQFYANHGIYDNQISEHFDDKVSGSRNMSVGDNIKRMREMASLSQKELAEILGVSDKTVSSWEINRTEPKMGMVEKICDALKCKKTAIVGEDSSAPGDGEPYYLNEDAKDLAQFLFENPEYKVLFDASRKVKKEDIDFVKQMMDRMRNNPDDTGC